MIKRSDRTGQAGAITAFTPIVPGRTEALQAYLRALPHGAESPLARLERTHLARWVIIDRLPADSPQPDRLDRDRLLFTCCVDGDPATYATEIAERIPQEAEAIWSHCDGFPGASDPAAFGRWLLEHHVPTSFFVAGYPDATVADIRAALAAHADLVRFAIGAQDLDPAARHARFKEAFAA